ATILDRAAAEIVNHPELRAFDALVHDDYQDATLATSRLLGELARGGARLLLTANPDTGVQGFRGGLPALTHTATLPEGSQDGAFGAQVHVLDSVTMAPRLWQGLSELAEELPPLIGAARRRATAGGDEGDGGVQCVLLPSGSQEAAFLARRLRELHLFDDVPWSDIAVRSEEHTSELQSRLDAVC